MALLDVTGLTMAYADKKLYTDAGFTLERGEHLGIVGQNGAGKSTLIKILTGKVLPIAGRVEWKKKIQIGYLDQYADIPSGMSLIDFLHTAYSDLYDKEKKMTDLYSKYAELVDDKLLERATRFQNELDAADFYSIDNNVEQVITGLGLDSIGRDHIISEMSGGQRAKIILAKLLLEGNDVIILDEPTNYLDVSHIKWLEGYLQNYDGAALIISHDFDFLNNVANVILDVSFNTLTKYRGNFDQAMRQKTEKTEQQLRAYNKQQEVTKKTKTFIQKNKARASTTGRAKSREKMLAHMDIIEPPQTNPKATFKFTYIESQSTDALKAERLVVGYDPKKPVLNPITFSMSSGDKIVFTGFNGAGKSTLIKTLLGILPAISGKSKFSPSAKTNYFDQDLIWDDDKKTPLQIMQAAYPLEEQKQLRQRLGAAGINADNATKQMCLLSGGEQTKVKLALMELTPSNFLILDEPTNHLDEATKNSLKKAIQKFDGSLILVTHERSFYEGWIDKVIDIASMSNMQPGEVEE
ncbi:ABC transporter ATP-binding protein [Oenococcus oeni]|uniref:ABC-F family ATP-binding cassette domain-containing protein n=1 Tax=Oenococcus oeni TaxID=1247 RepID=UPI0008F85301|nr:ABC-F family ATP-binding cassette domain-containing protein [Oenococcus oeni]OIL71339.1 ABC transporter ATP-binding protein [Oenococcus oeni]